MTRFDEVVVLPHNDPDPDAIASGAGLCYLLQQAAGVKGIMMYEGIVGRAENRALVKYLDTPLQSLNRRTFPNGRPVFLVDTQPGAGNNPWQAHIGLAGVIDHHPWREQSRLAPFFDVRPELGSAATMVFEYILAAGLTLPQKLATALFYGIKTDTRGLSRGVSPGDAAAYFYLQPRVDVDGLAEIERAQVPASYFKNFANALATTRIFGSAAITNVGPMDYPDMAAEMADLLIRLENMDWVVCLGIYQHRVLLAVRSTGVRGDAGSLVRAIVQTDGTAGGHDNMAGGQIPLQNTSAGEMIDQLTRRVLQALNIEPDALPGFLV